MSSFFDNPIDKRSVYISAGLMSATGALLLNVMPVLFGSLVEEFKLSASQLGNLALTANMAFALVGVISLAWVRVFNWRSISCIATLTLMLAFLSTLFGKVSYSSLIFSFLLGGAATGALYALAMVIFGDSYQPERAFGIKLGLESMPGALLLLSLPVVVAPAWGYEGVMIALALSALIMGIFPLPWVPSKGIDRKLAGAQAKSEKKNIAVVWLSLAASLIFLMGIIGSWAFFELMGKETGLSSDIVGIVLSIGFAVNAVGGFVASFLGLKVGRILPVVLVILAELVGLFLISQFSSIITFSAGVMLFLFSINFVLAYTFGLMAEHDPSGKLSALGAVCVSVGAALGPFISGYIIELRGYSDALIFSGICSVVTLVIYLIASRYNANESLNKSCTNDGLAT